MCNIWLRSDGRVERKGGYRVYRHTDSWHEWLQDNFYGGSATKRIVIKEPSFDSVNQQLVLVGQRSEKNKILYTATSESKFYYLIIATKQFFSNNKMGFYLISYGYRNSQLNFIQNLFCYLSLEVVFQIHEKTEFYRPMFYNFYGGDEMITKFND